MLHYPRLQAQYGLTLQEIRAFVENLQQLAEVVNDPPTDQETSLGTDPDDNPILRAAALGRAEAICTRDRHFQHPAVKQYCDERGVRVLTDIELLQLLRPAERDQ